MFKTLLSALHSGIEITFLVALLSASLRGGQRGLPLFLKWGTVTATVLSAGLTYSIISSFANRETVELAVNGAAAILGAALIWWLSRKLRWNTEKTGDISRAQPVFIFLATTTIITVPALEFILAQTREAMRFGSPFSTESDPKIWPALLALFASGVAGTVLYRVASRVKRRWVIAATLFFVVILFLGNAVTALQIMLVRGVIPLADWIFRPVAFMVNHRGALFYALLFVTAGLMLVAFGESKRRGEPVGDLNPAQRRRVKADAKHLRSLVFTVSLVLLMVMASESAYAFFGNRPVQLSPATPVAAENGVVKISEESLADGKLHRYAFTTGANASVRFLVIYKGSGLYGVGLDACEFCGVAGYRQEKDNVVCNRCNAAINKTTIGFPGGCNPMPVHYHNESPFVAIPSEELEAVGRVFAR